MDVIATIDTNILWWIQHNMVNPFMNTAMPFITQLGDAGIVWIVIGLALLITKKYRDAGFTLLLSLVLCVILGNMILKPLLARPRPFHIDSTLTLLIPNPHGFSFPSGHTMSSFAGAGALYFHNKKLGIPSLVLAFFIAFSRLYLFVHYPSDIIAGAVLGILTALLAKRLVDSFTGV